MYELNYIYYHHPPKWSRPLQSRQGLPLGYQTCGIIRSARLSRAYSSSSNMTSICTTCSVMRPLSSEEGSLLIFTNICEADGLPRSVTLYHKRNCVAFHSESCIELYWLKAITKRARVLACANLVARLHNSIFCRYDKAWIRRSHRG